MNGLSEVLAGPRLAAYTYSYPHKTAHRPLERPIALRDLWATEDRRSLFLYFHVPFCSCRCGYCNLLSLARPQKQLVQRWLNSVERQADRTLEALNGAQFARMAIGGGTPTLLELSDLNRLLRVSEKMAGNATAAIPISVEVSPSTVSEDKMARLRQFGVNRVSIGVQTFVPEEASLIGRPQPPELLNQALRTIRDSDFPVLNIDLIYGLPGQTIESWLHTVQAALTWRPEEIFIYPLYVRPLTRLAGHDNEQKAWSLSAYRDARDRLLCEGYIQCSMRLFRAPHAPSQDSPPYRCQDDGMVGIGCGARSYTRCLHYSTPYAVRQNNVAKLIEQFADRSAESFDWANHGIQLDEEDQKRRYVLLSLLEHDGLEVVPYTTRFGSHPLADFPELQSLLQHRLMHADSDYIRLTELGLEWSDAIGPSLYSNKVRRLMEEYTQC